MNTNHWQPLHLKIVRCSDSQMWYSDKIGQYVPFLGYIESDYKSREPAGYVNIVRRSDAVLEEIK